MSPTSSAPVSPALAPGCASPSATCSGCSLRAFCMPAGLTAQEFEQVDALVTGRRKVLRGAALFCDGDAYDALYAIRTGVFKTRVATKQGRDQVTGFHIAGEWLGLDAIAAEVHRGDAIALEDAEVCVLPFQRMAELSRSVAALQQHVHRLMSREIVRENVMMLLLGSLRAEERLAAFLLNLAQRLQARGFSGSDMVLRMKRHEIGSYVGLKLETVSRTFSRFAEKGWISVRQRHLCIRDIEALQRLLDPAPAAP